MKNKFFAFFELIPISIILFVICIGIFMGCFLSDSLEPTYLLIIFIILLIALPSVVLIFGVLTGCIMVEVTEEGIATVLFGKRLKYFKWEEIFEAETYIGRETRQHIIFRKNNINSRRKKREDIHFSFYCLDKSRMAILKQYAPNYIIDKLNDKDN